MEKRISYTEICSTSVNRLYSYEEVDNIIIYGNNEINILLVDKNIIEIEINRYLLVPDKKEDDDLYPAIEHRKFYLCKNYLFDFWENYLEKFLIERKQECSLLEFWFNMEVAFFNYYGFTWEDNLEVLDFKTFIYLTNRPISSGTEESIDFFGGDARNRHGSFDSIHFYNETYVDSTVFSIFLKENDHKFYKKEYSLTDSTENTYLGLNDWLLTGFTSSAKVILRKEIIKELKKSKEPLGIDSLLFQLNISDFKCGLPKPYSKELITEIINENKERFLTTPIGEITLIDETEFLPKFFFDSRELLTNFNFNKSASGILAFSYLGNKFPLNEAEEYVNVRPVIHLALVKNLEEEFPKHISDITENEEFTPQREFMFFLKAVLPEDVSVEEWLNENIAVSFYEEDAQDLKLVMPKIIGHLSPVFNLAQNPGHLFTYTLQKKREEYDKRHSRELKDGN